jgi:hypothetical protein
MPKNWCPTILDSFLELKLLAHMTLQNKILLNSYLFSVNSTFNLIKVNNIGLKSLNQPFKKICF